MYEVPLKVLLTKTFAGVPPKSLHCNEIPLKSLSYQLVYSRAPIFVPVLCPYLRRPTPSPANSLR